MAITQVQGPTRGTNSAGTITVTLASTPTSGNLLFALIGMDSYPTRTVTSISQTNVTWNGTADVAKTGPSATTYSRAEIWSGVASASAGKTVTITLSGTPINGGVANVLEYSGLLTSEFLDKTASVDGDSGHNPVTGTTATTTQADELCLGCIAADFSSGPYHDCSSPTNSFTLLDGVGIATWLAYAALARIVSSTGTYSSSVDSTNTLDDYAGVIATYKAAAGVTTYTKDFTLGAGLLKNLTKTFTAGAGLLKNLTKTFTLGSNLQKEQTTSFTLGAGLTKSLTKTFSIGGQLESGQTQSFSIGADLLQNLTKTFTLGAELQAAGTETKGFTIGANILQNFTKTFTVGAELDALGTQTVSFTIGAILERESVTQVGTSPPIFISHHREIRTERDLTPEERSVERVPLQPLLEGMTFEEMVRYVYTCLHPKQPTEEELRQRLGELLSKLPKPESPEDMEEELRLIIRKYAPKLQVTNTEDKLKETIRKSLEENKNE